MNTSAHKLTDYVLRFSIPAVLVLLSLFLLTTPYPFLALLPAAGLLGFLWLGYRNWVPYLFYGIVWLIPFGAYRGLSGPFSFVRLHWIFAIALAAFVSIRIVFRKQVPEEVRHGKFWVTVFLFYIANVFAALGSMFPATSARFMLLLLAGYLLVALGMIVVDQKGFSKTLPHAIIGSVFVGSLLAMAGGVFHLKLFVDQQGRALGAAPDPNGMSLMIIFSLPLALYFLLTASRIRTRLFMLLVMAVDIMAVIATFSRGGALVLAFALALMLWEFRRLIAPRTLGLLLGVSGIAVAALLVLSPESYAQRIQSIRTADDLPMRRRASYLVAARELVADRPLLGSGPNTFASRYEQTEIGRIFKREDESGKRKAHNTYVEVLVGSGVVGLTLFLAIIFCALKSLGWARRIFLATGRPEMALLTTAYRTSFLTMLVYFLMYSEVNHKYLLVSLAVSQVALRLAQKPISKQEAEDACG